MRIEGWFFIKFSASTVLNFVNLAPIMTVTPFNCSQCWLNMASGSNTRVMEMMRLTILMLCLFGSIYNALGYAQDISAYKGVLDTEAGKFDGPISQKPPAQPSKRSVLLPESAEPDFKRFDVRRDDLPAGLTPAQLATTLQNYFMGSYYYFKQLDDAKRQLVYQQYRSNPRLSIIRSTIIRLALGENKNDSPEDDFILN
jgi:hypothetical protein